MPVFMPRERWQEWLDPMNRDIKSVQMLMEREDPADGLVTRPVSTRVNIVANNGPELIDAIELGEPETLF